MPFFRRKRAPALEQPTGALPPGERVYAVGDIHGRLDLLDDLLAQIAADDAARPSARTTLLFLGDLVDRGPASQGVVQRLLELSREDRPTRFIMGNHEEMLLGTRAGDRQTAKLFDRVGGRETLMSYGVDRPTYDAADFGELMALAHAHVPEEHAAFLRGFEDVVEIGDYAFVHAGIRPDVPLAEQVTDDLRWIREPFLSHPTAHEKVIVHGHTITPEIDVRTNRIGLDTGAFLTGRLTAMGFEGEERWMLQAVGTATGELAPA